MFQSLKGIHVVCDTPLNVACGAEMSFQSLKGIHVVCDKNVAIAYFIAPMFQSLKGIHVVCDPICPVPAVVRMQVSIPERDSCRL